MGVVASHPADLRTLYESDYYAADPSARLGYEAYDETAGHGVSWAAAMARCLVPAGRALDVGCANGMLLRHLGEPYRCFGIEVNGEMAAVSERAGISIIANDLFDADGLSVHARSFDLVFAVAVLEHLSDLREGLEALRRLLSDDGFLILEVPLVDEDGTDSIWYRHSLEHIYYPTQRSLDHAIRDVFDSELCGGPFEITGFGTTSIAMVASDPSARPVAERLWRDMTSTDPGRLNQETTDARFMLRLVHGAHRDAATLQLLQGVQPGALSPAVLKRLSELWSLDAAQAQDSEERLRAVEGARDWHAAQSERWRAIAEARFRTPLRLLQAALRTVRPPRR
jgi:SAM-dependent methyltransferase